MNENLLRALGVVITGAVLGGREGCGSHAHPHAEEGHEAAPEEVERLIT